MTTRVWKTNYLMGEVIPALRAAGYIVSVDDEGFVKARDEDGEAHLIALPHTAEQRNHIVRYDRKLFDESAEREYPGGMERKKTPPPPSYRLDRLLHVTEGEAGS